MILRSTCTCKCTLLWIDIVTRYYHQNYHWFNQINIKKKEEENIDCEIKQAEIKKNMSALMQTYWMKYIKSDHWRQDNFENKN